MFTIVPFIKLIDSNEGRGGKYSTNSVIFSSRDWFRDWLLYKFVGDIAIDQFIRGKTRISLNVAKIREKLEHDATSHR